MQIKELLKQTGKPALYTRGNSFMWTDRYISKQLLQIHLNKDIDLASRKEASIDKTIDWLLSKTDKSRLKILDLGCGPGLYTSRLACHGHDVTGLDISEESIKYARKAADRDKLRISYNRADYLETDLGESEFDLIIMIYTDFGVLLPDERSLLLNKIRKALKPEGRFVFDVLNDNHFSDKCSDMSWDAEEAGFWSSKSYLHLSVSYVYADEKVILYRHLVADDSDDIKSYMFWTHFFSHKDLTEIMDSAGLKTLDFQENVLGGESLWDGGNVTFIEAGLN